MKNKKNKSTNFLKIGILLFGISILLWNCENEQINQNEITSHTVNNHSNTKGIALNDLLANDALFNELSLPYLPNKSQHKNVTSKNSTNNNNDLIIISDTINVIEKENYKSYTIGILRKDKKYDVENLVVEIKEGVKKCLHSFL